MISSISGRRHDCDMTCCVALPKVSRASSKAPTNKKTASSSKYLDSDYHPCICKVVEYPACLQPARKEYMPLQTQVGSYSTVLTDQRAAATPVEARSATDLT